MTVFIDESYTSRDYYVAALLVDDEQKAVLEARFQELRQEARFKWKVPDDIEFHAHELMQGRGPWLPLLGRVGDAASLYRKLLKAIVDSGARIAVQSVDIVRLNLRFQYPATPYEVAVRRALEQVNLWCKQDGLGMAQIIADDIGQDYERASAAFRRIVDGTNPAASAAHPGRLAQIKESVILANSSEVTGVQAADLVVHIVRRHLEETDAAPQARRLARSLHNILQPALRYSTKWRP